MLSCPIPEKVGCNTYGCSIIRDEISTAPTNIGCGVFLLEHTLIRARATLSHPEDNKR